MHEQTRISRDIGGIVRPSAPIGASRERSSREDRGPSQIGARRGVLRAARAAGSRRRASFGASGAHRRVPTGAIDATGGTDVSTDSKALVQKLWDFCDVLRDDGLSYGEYLEQLTYLLFLKMADEQYEQLGGERVVPGGFGWQSLLRRSGVELEQHYSTILEELGTGDDMLGVVFRKARNRVQDPAKLERLIKEFVDRHEWLSLDADLKGDAYEGLIEKTAQEGARGGGPVLHATGAHIGHHRRNAPRPG